MGDVCERRCMECRTDRRGEGMHDKQSDATSTATRAEQRSGLSDAAGRAAMFPARAAARVWRDQLEEAVDEMLSAPEIARVIDRALAGSLPEEIARSVVRHRVLERMVEELAASGELERLLNAASGEPTHARAHRPDARERRDPTCLAAGRVQSGDSGCAETADGGPRRGGSGRAPCVCMRLDGHAEHAVSRRSESTAQPLPASRRVPLRSRPMRS